MSVKDKRAAQPFWGRDIAGQLRAGRGWQMAVDLDKQLGCIHLAKMHLILHPPVTDFVLTWLPKNELPSLRVTHEGDFTSSRLCSSTEAWPEDVIYYKL